MTHEADLQAAPAPPRRPYVTPVLKVFGGVTAITSTRTMTGAIRDGGPNNSKT